MPPAFAPAAYYPDEAFAGPVYAPFLEGSGLYAPALYAMPPQDFPPVGLVAVPAGVIPADVSHVGTLAGERPAPMRMLSGDVPHFLPDSPPTLVDVDEPASVWILTGMLVLAGWARWRA